MGGRPAEDDPRYMNISLAKDGSTRGSTAMTDQITLRLADDGDQLALARLAALDEGPRPAGRTLVAEAGTRLVAALPLDRGRPIADPFERTAELLSLLRIRAAQLC